MQSYLLNWDAMISVKEALHNGERRLSQQVETAHLEAEILLQHTLKVSRTHLYAHAEDPIPTDQYTAYLTAVAKRASGTPIAYITGQRDFWSFTLTVTPDTLIPRPDTELLVETTLQRLDEKAPLSVLDLGTGSGAIALALATERPHWQITASDQQPAALEIAQSSAKRLGLKNITFICSDWFQALKNRSFHAIVSNPPYLAQHDPHLTQGDLRFEPKTALIAGDNGLEALHFIIKHSYHHLFNQGQLLLEHGYEQGAAVNALLSSHGYHDIHSWKDLQGHDRVTGGKRPITIDDTT